ncbi:MAG: winged helix-turn-helix domain-containing protein [Gemmatimonadales bacterium]
MTDRPNPGSPLSVGDLTVDRRALEISRNGGRLDVSPQAVRVLLVLADRAGELVTREELYDAIWGHRDIDVDRGLNTLIRQLRIGLADSATAPRYIRTYPRRGYRLIAEPPLDTLPLPAVVAQGVMDPVPRPPEARHPATGRLPVSRRRALAVAVGLGLIGFAAGRWIVEQPPAVDRVAVTVAATVAMDSLTVGQLAFDLRETLGAALERRGALLTGWSLPHAADLSEVAAAGARWVAAGRMVPAGLHFDLIRLPERDTVARIEVPRPSSPADLASLSAQRLATALGLELNELADASAGRAGPTGPAALRYLIGRHWLRSATPELRARSVDFLSEAVAAAPSATVRAHLAEGLFWAGRLAAADSQARLALAADSSDSHALFMSGVLAHLVKWDGERAATLLQRAVAQQPARPEYRSALAFLEATRGNGATAMTLIAETYRRDPLSAILVADVGEMAHYSGDPRAAARYCREAAMVQESPWSALQCLFEAQLEAGDTSAAALTAGRLVTLGVGRLGLELDSRSAPAAVRALRERQADLAVERLRAGAGSAFLAASFLAAAGRRDDALTALSRAVDAGEPWVVAAGVHPRFRPIRTDARFQELISRVKPHQPPAGRL